MKKSNSILVVVVLLCFLVLGTGSVFGAVYYEPTYANLSENFIFNITVSAPPGNNITQIQMQSQAFSFAQNHSSNSTSRPPNLTGYFVAGDVINWYNLTLGPLVNNGTNQSFYIMMNSTMPGSPAFSTFNICLYNNTNLTRIACGGDAYKVGGTTAAKIGVNIIFSGYVKIENGSFQNGTNVTLYEFVAGSNGPPTETYLSSVLTNAQGLFRFSGINGSKELYKLKMFYNNGTANTHVGSILPPMPKFMFFQMDLGDRFMDAAFKKPANLNGTTYYLQPAATLNITAKGNATGAIRVKFGYEVVDQNLGFPVESNLFQSVWSQQIIVPIDRAFTVMVSRHPLIFTTNASCTADGVMTADACPSPPTSLTIPKANLSGSQGAMLDVEMNMTYGEYSLTGCISLYGNNTPGINVTTVQMKMMPWAGFVPPMNALRSTFNITNGSVNIAYNDARCPGGRAWYNLSVMGASSGIMYMLEFYGKNASTAAGYPGLTSVNLAAFQNFTMLNGAQRLNLTLRSLAGAYNDTVTNELNTSRIKVNILNSTGGLISTGMHVNLQVKNPVTGTVNYIIESLSSGVFYFSALNNSNWAKVMVYPQEGPPVEKTLNLSLSENNVTVMTGEAGFRRMNRSSGLLEAVNVTSSVQSINISFYRYVSGVDSEGCNLPMPPVSCLLTQMDAQNFNPMTLMMASKVNLEMKFLNTGTTLYFINFDLFAAKPPTNSVLNGNASQADKNSQTQVWEAGSFVPVVYDYAFVGMPYSTDSSATDYINENYRFNMSLPYFKDEDWNVVWNRSAGDTNATLPDAYAAYNTNEYNGLLTAAGVNCSTSNASEVCFMNKSQNMFWVKVPHFSGGGYGIGGGTDAAVSTSTTTSSSSTSVGGSSGASSSSVTESHIIVSVAAEVPLTIAANVGNTGINDILVTPSEAIDNLKVSFTKLSSLPETVTETPEGILYSYLQIEAPKLAGKIAPAKIHFEVKKSWLTDNGFAADNVVLQRFTTSWEELDTKKLRDDNNNVYYESVTPGFSYFAISAIEDNTVTEELAEQPLGQETQEKQQSITSLPSKKSYVWIYGLIALVIALAALITASLSRRKK